MAARKFEIQNLTRECNEALILAVLSRGKRHGYQIALEIEERSGGFFRFNHGTLYPILHKLEKDGLIDGAWKGNAPRRRRKYYVLTSKGRKYLFGRIGSWRGFCDSFFNIVEERQR